MSVEESLSSLRREALSGDNRDLTLRAAEGLLPLPPGELVALQVTLAGSESPEVASRAEAALRSFDPKIAAAAVADSSDLEVLEYVARVHPHPLVLETVLRNQHVRGALLARLAADLSPDLQEILLLRQDAIIEDPSILDALEGNAELSRYSRRRIQEYRQHLLPAEPEEEQPPVLEEVTEEEVREALVLAHGTVASGETEALTGLSESQLKTLPVPIRLKLARGSPRGLRQILIRDPNTQVAIAVLKFNSMADSEIEQISSSRTVSEDVLEEIGRDRKWIRKYGILRALVQNPKTPIGLAIRLIPRLSVRDLRSLSRDRNVSEAVRARAAKLFKIKRG